MTENPNVAIHREIHEKLQRGDFEAMPGSLCTSLQALTAKRRY